MGKQLKVAGEPDAMKIWRLPIAVLLALVSFSTAAFAAAAKADLESITELAIRAHMGFLASDAMNGRGSGTRDEWIAATYIAAVMRRAGLQPMGDGGDFVQPVQISRVEVVGPPMLTVGASTNIHGNQMVVMRLKDSSFHGPLQRYSAHTAVKPGVALLIPAGTDAESVQDIQSAGLVLWHETAAQRAHWDDLLRRSTVVGRPKIEALPDSPLPAQSAPSKIILCADAYAAMAEVPDGSMTTLTAQTQQVSSHTWNAVGRLAGRGEEQSTGVVLLSAHLDHLGSRNTGLDRIYNGADDDASGSTAVLTLAEALAKGPRLRRTIVFAWFGSEEVGGYGARYFVEKPVVPLNRIVANLEFEMIGRPDASIAPRTLWLTGWQRTSLGPELAAHGARLVADPHPKEKFFTRSDNFTLARRGVIAQTVSSFGLHEDYHQPSDDLEHIDFAHMAAAIQSLLKPIRWLADSNFRPDWVPGGRPE